MAIGKIQIGFRPRTSFCAKNPKSLKIKTKLSNVSDCLLIPTLCFEENRRATKESNHGPQLMKRPCHYNLTRKKDDKPLIIICVQTPVQ